MMILTNIGREREKKENSHLIHFYFLLEKDFRDAEIS